jgi:ATP-dependent exoDNAse (exonuclease V) beta subunit
MQTTTPLKILSASAGSGKTFSLVQSYLALTIGENANPKSFSKIIAMTFTNKAAWEMKARIIEALDYLAFPNRADSKETKKALNLLVETKKTVGLTDSEIQRKSKIALSEILHHYEDFHVMTIDKFSLRLIRTFSRDLDLSDDFEIVLDQRELLEQVVDELLSKIGKEGEEQVTKLTLDYAKSNLAEGDKWNFRSNLIDFAKVLTVENDQVYIEELIKKPFTSEAYFALKNEIESLNNSYSEKANELFNYFQNLNTESKDYPQGNTGIYGWLGKLKDSNLENQKDINSYVQKTLTGENVNEKHNVDAGLVSRTIEFLSFKSKCLDRYFLLKKLRKNFYNLALLKHISHELNLFKERQNVIGIYEFSRKIADLLSKENAPYIYERLGTRFQHYLLDEFQDTSRLQWLNLIPLVHDSISNGYENLIVGDPKQAIYRFRNGLVEQFVALPAIYNPEKDKNLEQISNYFKEMGEKSPLNENYRSRKNIVSFNNQFFQNTLEQLPENFSDYYKDIFQNPMGQDGGYVGIELYNSKNEDDLTELEHAFLLKTVRKCLSDGYKCGDICVLARKKKEGNEWAKVLNRAEEQFHVVSADSLSVSSDQTVRFFVDYFELRKNSGNPTAQIKFASSYYQVLGKDPLIELEDFWKGRVGKLDFEKFVKVYFESEENVFMDFENMYDLGQKFSHLTSVHELQNPYLHHFMEILQQYDLRFGPDLRGFLEHWNTKASSETVQMPENDHAIKIMTIHKSKGLEFPIVILPNLEWKISPSRSEQFVQADSDDVIYSKLSKENVPNYMTEAYNIEYEQQLLDAFNLLYVTMTRAKDRIYTLIDSKQEDFKKEHFSLLSQPVMKALNASKDEIFDFVDDTKLSLGKEDQLETTETDANYGFRPTDISDFLWFPEMSLKDSDALEHEGLNREQRFGNQLHLVLAQVNNVEEIDKVIDSLFKNDVIEKEFIEEIKSTTQTIFEIEDYKQLLHLGDKILSEQDILLDEKQTQRPDKLIFKDGEVTVVDFKTGKPLKKHQSQVMSYVNVLKIMGYSNVSGYLLYPSEKALSKVI